MICIKNHGGVEMRNVFVLGIVALLTLAMGIGFGGAQPPGETNGNDKCTTIQSGELEYSDGHYMEGEPLMTGFDPYGYNYQAHMFEGTYCNVYLGEYGYPAYEGNDEAYYERLVDEGYADNTTEAEELMNDVWCWDSRDTQLLMKWNDAWLSNEDCEEDGKLDRHYGHDSYKGSGAWLTNQMMGGQGKDKWTYFTKIAAVPEDAYEEDGTWYTAEGSEIGPVMWGSFAKIQTVESGEGATNVSPTSAGLGHYK